MFRTASILCSVTKASNTDRQMEGDMQEQTTSTEQYA